MIKPIRLAVLLASFGTAGNAVAIDLLQTYELAVRNDSTLTAARLSSEAGEMTLEIVKSTKYPEIGIGASYLNRPEQSASNIRESVGEITVRQPIWNQALNSRIKAAESEVRTATLQFTKVESELYVRVVHAYFGVLAAEDNLQTANSEVAAIEKHLDLAQRRFEVGLGTQIDVRDAEARSSLARTSAIQAASAIESAWLALTEITGIRPESLARLADNVRINPPMPEDVAWWVESALKNNSDLVVMRETVNLASFAIDIEAANSKPTVNLSATYRNKLTGPMQGDDETTLSLTASIAFSTGGYVSKRVRQARLNYESQIQSLKAFERQIKSGVSTAYLNVISLANQVNALATAVDASEIALGARQEGYDVGLLTSLDVLNAHRDVFKVTRDYQKARYDYFQSVIVLEQLAGLLDRVDLERLNRSLEL